jgi:hypothetical protein
MSVLRETSMIYLRKISVDNEGAFYQFYDEGEFLFYVATHTYQQEDGSWLPKTLAGVYDLVRGEHTIPTGEQFYTFEVMNVPGHTGILLPHPGNLPERDSDGCYLCGTHVSTMNGAKDVSNSRDAYSLFLVHFDGLTSGQVTIE